MGKPERHSLVREPLQTRGLLDDQCAGHVRVTFASADINIGSCWRSHDDSQGLPRSNHNAGSTGRFTEIIGTFFVSVISDACPHCCLIHR